METTYVRSYAKDEKTSVFRNMFGWMAMALVISGLAAMVSMNLLESSVAYQQFLFGGAGIWVLFGAEIILVLVLTWALNKLSLLAATSLFILYSIVSGLTLTPLAYVYTGESITSTFLITAGAFGSLAAYGYVTKKDLSKIGNLCMMALFGLIIATVVNLFMKSETMSYIMAYVGVLLFSGLTLFDVQRFKKAILDSEGTSTDDLKKIALMGALNLYLDFINMFIYLLRILGKRN